VAVGKHLIHTEWVSKQACIICGALFTPRRRAIAASNGQENCPDERATPEQRRLVSAAGFERERVAAHEGGHATVSRGRRFNKLAPIHNFLAASNKEFFQAQTICCRPPLNTVCEYQRGQRPVVARPGAGTVGLLVLIVRRPWL
jgi:hypothetical protein